MSAAMAEERVAGPVPGRVAALNDEFRRTGRGGRVMMTAGVAALSDANRLALVEAVRTFSAFGPDNDPHREHDFGVVAISGLRCFWKIDAYDRELRFGSPDSADPAVTVRVLTIMLVEEY